MQGIDVSHWDGDVDWSKVASSFDFAILKATDGSAPDPTFPGNLEGARAAGVNIIGAYHFFRTSVSVDVQFNNILATVKLQPGDLRLAIDVENVVLNKKPVQTLKPADVPNLAELVGRVSDTFGYSPFIYTSKVLWDSIGDPAVVGAVDFSQCPFWVAHYTSKPAPNIPQTWKTWQIWQYSQSGSVDGISASVDMNRTVNDLTPWLIS